MYPFLLVFKRKLEMRHAGCVSRERNLVKKFSRFISKGISYPFDDDYLYYKMYAFASFLVVSYFS